MLVEAPGATDPVDGRPCRLLEVDRQLLTAGAQGGPAEHREEERGHVDAAVVARVRNQAQRGQLAAAQLVDNQPRLLERGGVVTGPLGTRQGSQDLGGKGGVVVGDQLGGQEAVPAEEGEEPGRAGAGDDLRRVLR